MRKLCLLLLLAINCLLATPIYDDKQPDQLNLSASCPNTSCVLLELQSDFQQPLLYSGGQLTQLLKLQLGNCRMRNMPAELLRLTPNLLSLAVTNSSINQLKKDDFQSISQLRTLQLLGNRISRLNEQQFVALTNLEVLQLNHNSIQFLNSQAFTGLSKLKLLGLQSNGITELGSGAFEPLSNLQHLDLSNNDIRHLDARTLAKNFKLQTLLLNGNPLANFEPQTLAGLNSLRLLDLSNCGELAELRLQSIQKLQLESSGVQRLFINGGVISLQAGNNALTQLVIGDKSAVIELDLHGNQLDDNASYVLLAGMWNLQKLDLSNNNIESLSSSSSNLSLLLPSLTHLNLAQNQLRRVPLELPLFATRLLQLNISNNPSLSMKAKDFAALSSLQHLFMEGNSLGEFDYELFHKQHSLLKELGICDKASSYRFTQKMMLYLTDRGVSLKVSCLHHPTTRSDPELELEELSAVTVQSQPQVGVCGIHPYWTTRDVLAFLTLVVVFIILLIQLYHIMEYEGLLQRVRLWFRPNVMNGARPRRIIEEDSEV